MLQTKRLLGISSYRVANSFRNGIIYAFMGLYLRENLQLSVTESNLLFTLLELIGALGQFLLWGWIADKYKWRTTLLLLAETIPPIGYFAVFYLHKYLLLTKGAHAAGLSILFGLSAFELVWGAGFTGYYALLADIPDYRVRSKYQGYTITLSSAGHIAGSLIGGLFFDWKYPGGGFGDGLLFFILSPIILGFAALTLLCRKEAEVNDHFTGKNGIELDIINQSTSQELLIENTSEQQHRKEGTSLNVFYWFLVGIMVSSLAQGAIAHITLYFLRLPESIALSSFAVSLLLTTRWIGHLISGPIASKISERYATVGYLAALIWFACLPMLYPLVESLWFAILLFVGNGLAMGLSTVTSFVLISEIIPPEKRGQLLSQWNALQMVSWGAGGSVIGGPLADWRISQGTSLAAAYVFTFFVAFLMGVGAIVLTVWKARSVLKRN